MFVGDVVTIIDDDTGGIQRTISSKSGLSITFSGDPIGTAYTPANNARIEKDHYTRANNARIEKDHYTRANNARIEIALPIITFAGDPITNAYTRANNAHITFGTPVTDIHWRTPPFYESVYHFLLGETDGVVASTEQKVGLELETGAGGDTQIALANNELTFQEDSVVVLTAEIRLSYKNEDSDWSLGKGRVFIDVYLKHYRASENRWVENDRHTLYLRTREESTPNNVAAQHTWTPYEFIGGVEKGDKLAFFVKMNTDQPGLQANVDDSKVRISDDPNDVAARSLMQITRLRARVVIPAYIASIVGNAAVQRTNLGTVQQHTMFSRKSDNDIVVLSGPTPAGGNPWQVQVRVYDPTANALKAAPNNTIAFPSAGGRPVGSANLDGTFYVLGGENALYSLNGALTSATALGNLTGLASYVSPQAMTAWDGALYMSAFENPGGADRMALYRINTATRAATRVGTMQYNSVNILSLHSLTVHKNKFYTMEWLSPWRLFTVDKDTGDLERVGTNTFQIANARGFDSFAGITDPGSLNGLYATTAEATHGYIYRIT